MKINVFYCQNNSFTFDHIKQINIMSFTGNENHSISLQNASDLTANFRANHPSAIKGFYFGKATLLSILNQSDCVGIRIYYGEDSSTVPVPCLVITGVKANEDDMETGVLAEYGTPCPPHCGTSNALNS